MEGISLLIWTVAVGLVGMLLEGAWGGVGRLLKRIRGK